MANKRTPAPTTGNGATGPRQKLKDPVQVGTLSVAEAEAIRERKRLREKYDADFRAKRDELNELSKVITIMQSEAEQFLFGIVRDRNLDQQDAYDIRSDTGVIWRVTGPADPVDDKQTTEIVEAPESTVEA